MRKIELLHVQGKPIRVEDDYICLTDMANNSNDADRAADVIKNWIRTKFTIDFLGAWERKNNRLFKVVEFDHFKKRSGMNDFSISVQEWIDKTEAIGIYAKRGKYGGTFAHKDIAFEFGSAISADFKLYLIEEFQRLKELERNVGNFDWSVRRTFAKNAYSIQTDAVKKYKLPLSKLPQSKQFVAYAEEGDILNLSLFGFTAKQWREAHLDLDNQGKNVRDFASVNELAVLSNLEGMNAELIKQELPYKTRLNQLSEMAKSQLAVLDRRYEQNSLRKDTQGNFQIYPNVKGIFPFPPNDRLGLS